MPSNLCIGHSTVLPNVVIEHNDITRMHFYKIGGLPEACPNHGANIRWKQFPIPVSRTGLTSIAGVIDQFTISELKPVVGIAFG
jgi:hypothetical protein